MWIKFVSSVFYETEVQGFGGYGTEREQDCHAETADRQNVLSDFCLSSKGASFY